MIVVTGAAGFIGSCVAKDLNLLYPGKVILVDDFTRQAKQTNLNILDGLLQIDRDKFFDWADDKGIKTIVHLGARTDTTEFDWAIFQKLNIDFTKSIWRFCEEKQARLIYASSAATYGEGEFGYEDNHEVVSKLKPLNPYGESKNQIDEWILSQTQSFPWYGLKFFNVYGPNEYHKGRMASVVLHAFNQVSASGSLKLFRSHKSEFKDGEQLRDFVYVKDVSKVINHLMTLDGRSGLYNLGTGKARTFLDLGRSVFRALDVSPNISFIDTPEDIRDKYQYYTEADMSKLEMTGYSQKFFSLEEGVNDYVTNYLKDHKLY